MAKKGKNNNNKGWHLAYELEGVAFGTADGVICTLGLIFGVAIATNNISLIIISAVAGGVANSFANSIGVFISQSAERGVQMQRKEIGHETHVHTKQETVLNAAFSFIASLAVLSILLLPFLIFNIGTALILTSILGIVILFTLGFMIAKLTRENRMKTAVIFVLLGIAGVVVGYIIGSLFKVNV